MRSRAATVLSLCLAAAAAAQPRATSPDEFRAFAEGRTLRFAAAEDPARIVGAEQYLPGGRVIWQDAAGRCVRGAWRARGQAACFTYADAPDRELCWRFARDEQGLLATLEGDDAAILRVVGASSRPLSCAPSGAGV
ncbi:hypothetical protein [Oceanicella actignis]|uniref:Protease inhibitor Inh n=1 Tax=Oceanicella actignis TaxID=1189325 RepID=A0A1M7T5A9_9RHOB|nr:hypothetical protein [Oceanicella actignis]TYO84877.1 hypothetical protein LY05_02850 [Oceanicella actignis]SET43058.1 hypothetical protein SAMN04488119_104184 [Oceanicella actignis]SHN65919.1 hypothetical protein SAMN05216200_104184 [Oceanicella actignis]